MPMIGSPTPTVWRGPNSGKTISGRSSYAPMRLDHRATGGYEPSNVSDAKYRIQPLTVGTNQAITPRFTNELRFNYSRSRGKSFSTLDDFGGAAPPPDSVLY